MTRHVGFRARALPLIGVIAASLSSWSAQARPDLTGVNVIPNGDDLTVELQLSESAPEAAVFALETPPRISIDLPDTGVALEDRRVAINQGVVQSLTAIETSERSRIVLNLTNLPQYAVSSAGNSVLIKLSQGAPSGAAQTPAAAASLAATQAEIRGMDFRRSETGAGRLLLKLSAETSDVDIRTEGGKIVAVFKNTHIDDGLITRMDVLDFATPVKFVDTTRQGINTRVTITPVSGAEFEQVAYQLGKTFTIELQPLTQRELDEIARTQPEFTGERLNVNFQNIEVRALLQIIADVAGKNLVTSDSVKGDITLRLENVPWDQALDIVMRTKGLSKTENGNVIWIAPTDEVAAQQAKEIEAQTQAEQLAPLVTEMIQVNYAKAVDLAGLIGEQGGGGGDREDSFLSPRGRISVDERTNTLIVRDTREKLEDLQRLIARLDIPVRQVLIESRLVVANDDFNRSIGSSLGVSFADAGDDVTIAGSGNIGAATQVQNFVSGTDFDDLNPNRLSTQFGAVSTGAAVPSYALSVLGSDFLVDLELSAIQAEGKGEVVSNPRVITADGKEAIIEQGEEIPFTSGGSGAATATTSFKEAVLALRVTPQITPDNRVIMDLEVSKDSRGEVVPQATGGSAVAIDTSSVTTQVLVNNAETVVLGGIYEQDQSEQVSKVPLLGDIPLLGFLFRNKTLSNSKRELLIFVTPKILHQGISTN